MCICISNFCFKSIIENAYSHILVGCGYRGDNTLHSADLQNNLLLLLGSYTQKVLADVGIEVSFIGDPTMILPLILPCHRNLLHKSIFMPHINDLDRLILYY